MTSDTANRSRYRSLRPYLAFLPLCFGVFIAADDLTVVATVLPEVLLSLEVPATNIDQAAWLVVAFLIGYTVTMPVMGRLSDRWGYRRAFAIALVIFAVGSALVAVSPATSDWIEDLPGPELSAYNFMVAARVVQALGAGAVIPIALASAGLVVGTRHQVVAYGMVGASAEAGGVIGPLWGGTIDSLLGWEYAFWLNIPLAIIAAVALLRMPAGRSNAVSVDWLGGITFAVALTTAAMAAFRIPNPDLAMALLAAVSIAAVAALALQIRYPGSLGGAVLRITRRTTSRAGTDDAAHVPRYIFGLSSFVGANVGHLLVGAALMIGMVSVPLAAGIVYEHDAFESGLWLLRMTLALGICALLGGMLAQRFGSRIPAVGGMVLATIGYLLFASWGLDVSEPLISLSLVLIGAGFGLVIAPIADRALFGVREGDRGLTAGIVTLTRNVGMAMGLAVLTPIGTEQILTMAPGIAELIAEPTASAEVGLDVFNAFALYAAAACAAAVIPLWVMTNHKSASDTSSDAV